MTEQSQDRPAVHSKGVLAFYEWLEALGSAIIIAMILFTFILRVNEVKGDSMLPNYTEGTRVIVQAIGYQPAVGDVVVIDATHTNLDEFVIKRVIATEGQTVDFDEFGTSVWMDSRWMKVRIWTLPLGHTVTIFLFLKPFRRAVCLYWEITEAIPQTAVLPIWGWWTRGM